jgi:hypothetical protein
MTDFFPSDHVRAAADMGGIVFLDTQADRYFCTPHCAPSGARDLLALSGASLPLGPDQAAGLLKSGLITPKCSAATKVAPRVQSAINAGRKEARVRDLPGVLHACFGARRQLQKPFARLLDLRETQDACDSECVKHIGALLSSFEAWRIYDPQSRICLFDSIALRFFLRRRGIASRIVFGVKTRPFEAHCWVQRGNQIINERLERARSFQPILII